MKNLVSLGTLPPRVPYLEPQKVSSRSRALLIHERLLEEASINLARAKTDEDMKLYLKEVNSQERVLERLRG